MLSHGFSGPRSWPLLLEMPGAAPPSHQPIHSASDNISYGPGQAPGSYPTLKICNQLDHISFYSDGVNYREMKHQKQFLDGYM